MNSEQSQDKTGPIFNLDQYLEARRLCIQATAEIIEKVVPGMTEKEAQALVKSVFAFYGVTQHWHATKFRIGADTVKNFREPTDVEILTSEGDVCFVDVGPVFFGHEADFGRTFIVGENPGSQTVRYQMMVQASEEIFTETAKYWRETRVTGQELFHFAGERAQARGFELNPKMPGHRLGDFPHQVYAQRENLFALDRVPAADLWVLEIHLLDLQTLRGAFFEDILRG